MAHKIFWLVLQGIVGMHNQSLILQDTTRFLLCELQKLTPQRGLCEMEHMWIIHLILLLMEQVELSYTLQMVLWYSQTVPHSLRRSLRDFLHSSMHKESERVRRMQ